MKKFLAILLAAVLCFALAACGGNANTEETTVADETTVAAAADLADIKMGLICLHDENSTYDANFIQAAKAASDELGFELVIKVNIP